ncbi:site-specific integrase [Listeria monocytogenes]|nr:site-specific integrase [Listeria monocytogenes]EIW4271010.1 site-specific integrase [Listeria monocytogenes]
MEKMGLVVKYDKKRKVWTWRARIYVNGQQYEKSGFERLKKEADDIGADKLAQLKKDVRTSNKITCKSSLEQLILEHISIKKLAKNSKKAYYRALKNHISPKIGSLSVENIDRIVYQKFINSLVESEKNYSKATIELINSVVNGALEFAYRHLRIIDINPATKIDINMNDSVDEFIKTDTNEYYSDEEINLLIQCANEKVELEKQKNIDKSALRDILFFLPRTGTRISEALGLLEEDFNEADSTIIINKQLTDETTAKKPEFGKVKTTDSNRLIYLDTETSKMIKKRIMLNKQFRLQHPEFKNNYNFIFSIQNKHMYRSKFRYYMNSISVKSGIPYHDGHLIHGLRHSHSKQLLEAGINEIDIKKRLGHSKYSTITNTYMHTDQTNQQRSLELYEKHISKEN